MLCSTVPTVLVTIAAFGSIASGLPTDAPWTVVQRDANPTTDLDPCESTPADYWQCISDCLYKICKTGDTPCVQSCDYNCGKSTLRCPSQNASFTHIAAPRIVAVGIVANMAISSQVSGGSLFSPAAPPSRGKYYPLSAEHAPATPVDT